MIGRRDLLRFLAAWPLAGRLRTWGSDSSAIVADLDAPAHYRRAFARLSTLTEADRSLVEGWRTVPLDKAVDGLLRRFAPALDDWRRGASTGRCEWPEVVSAEGLITGDHDIRNHRIGNIALLRARKLAESDREMEALDDVFAIASFGRHIGYSGLLISRVCQFAAENQAIAALGAILPRLGPEAMASIPARVEGLPPPCSWVETIRLEGRFIISNISENVAALSMPVSLEDLQGPPFLFFEADARAFFDATGGDPERILGLVRDLGPFLASLGEVVDLPGPSFGKALESFSARGGGINPFGALVVKWVDHARFAADRTELLWSMALAARTRIVDGLDRFRAIPDPFADGPFAIAERPGGFELRSALHREGKPPAILQVG